MNRRGRPPQPVARAIEIQANAHEMARALEFGGELGTERARRCAGAILRDAQAIQRQLDSGRAA